MATYLGMVDKLHTLCSTFNRLSSSERISKIGWDLQKLWSQSGGGFFF